MDNVTEQIYLLNTSENQPVAMEQKVDAVTMTSQDLKDFSTVCRICATVTESVMPIFEGEGLQSNLADKIHKHLPILVTTGDVLPRVVCYQCANTLLAWHELVQCAVQADVALRAHLQNTAPAAPDRAHLTEKEKSEPSIGTRKKRGSRAGSAVAAVAGAAPARPAIVTEGGKRYARCDVCNKNVAANSWRRHARAHTGERRHSCPTCGLAFSDGGNLARHARALHARLRPHRCPACARTFSRKSHLQDHVRSHAAGRDFVCAECGAACKSGAALRMHARAHAARRHACLHCGRAFRRRAELRAHVSVHTGERAHACACGRAFRLRAQLTRHARTHAGPAGTA